MGRKKKASSSENTERIFCWYCDRDFQEEKILASHQKEKHFKCQWCNKRLMSVKGLVVHAQQVHKEEVNKVPNAVEGRDSIEYDVFGMEGIPQSYWEEQARKRSRQGGGVPPSVLNGLGNGPYGYVPHLPFTALYGASPLTGYPRIPTAQYANPYVVPPTPVPPPVVGPGEIPAAPSAPLPTQYSSSPTYTTGYYQGTPTGAVPNVYAPPPVVPGQNTNVAAYLNSQVHYQSSPIMQSPASETQTTTAVQSSVKSSSGSGNSLQTHKSDSRVYKDIGNVRNMSQNQSGLSVTSSAQPTRTVKVRLIFCPADDEVSMEELRADLPRYRRNEIIS
eukprot:jgi/Galph1/597/GphlegSOOS_G5404.1